MSKSDFRLLNFVFEQMEPETLNLFGHVGQHKAKLTVVNAGEESKQEEKLWNGSWDILKLENECRIPVEWKKAKNQKWFRQENS